jgi:hypothetical protein
MHMPDPLHETASVTRLALSDAQRESPSRAVVQLCADTSVHDIEVSAYADRHTPQVWCHG